MFFSAVFLFTWIFWFSAAIISRTDFDNGISIILMVLGLFVPSVTSLVMVLKSKSRALKKDYKDKLSGFYRIKPLNVIFAIAVMGLIIVISILISLLFGESINQFSFVGGFSFSIGGIPTLLTLVLTALLEELGWRGYAEDSVAFYCSWFQESIIFGIVWALWHLPLFFIPDTYQYGILQMNVWYMVNFFISIVPMGFLLTWVYVKNGRSIFACMVFHFFVNFFQEQIAMTQVTKCFETIVIAAVAIIIVLINKDMFFEIRHVGYILENE